MIFLNGLLDVEKCKYKEIKTQQVGGKEAENMIESHP
jgi:hypothetical protein